MPSKRLLPTLVSPHTSPMHANSMSSHLSCPGPPLNLATSCIRCSSFKMRAISAHLFKRGLDEQDPQDWDDVDTLHTLHAQGLAIPVVEVLSPHAR